MDMERICERLIDIQAREGLSDGKFAARLGITRQLWVGIRTGKLRLTERVAVRAVGAFPELGGDLLNAAAESAA